MSYNRLLFCDEDEYLKWYSQDKTSFDMINRDINLDVVAEYILKLDGDFPIQYLLYPCHNRNTAELRSQVLMELHDNAAANAQLYNFFPSLSQLLKLRHITVDSQHIKQRQYYFLDTVILYIECAEGLYGIVKNLKSEAFANLTELLYSIIESESYNKMKTEAIILKDKILKMIDISIAFNYENSLLKIECQKQKDTKISVLAKKYFNIDLAPQYSIVNSNPITALEENIIDVMLANNSDVFNSLEKFNADYEAINVYDIVDLKPHIAYYTIFTNFIFKMENQGYTFSIPKFKDDFIASEAYDLGLALKLQDSSKVVSNDINLPKGSIFILSGPNQGGKTTFVRSIALTIALALNGCYVPCSKCEIPYYDSLFTHFNHVETLGKGGRLEEELTRIKQIVSVLTPNSFVLFNECFASTRRFDGVQLSLKLFDKLFSIGASGGFVTHYYEIADFDKRLISLVAGVASDDMRTFKIMPCPPDKNAYANTIAQQCGVTYNQLEDVINEYRKLHAVNDRRQ